MNAQERLDDVLDNVAKPAQETLDAILAHVAQGGIVAISNHLRCIHVRQKDINKFRKVGLELLVVRGDSLCIRQGKRLDSIKYCRITFFD